MVDETHLGTDQAEAILFDFLEGRVDTLCGRYCPRCGGRLVYSVYISKLKERGVPEGQRRCGVSLFCRGACGRMLMHLDGLCGDWVESVVDWDQWSEALYEESELRKQADSSP